MDKNKHLWLNSNNEFLLLDVSKIAFFMANGDETGIYFYNGRSDSVKMSLTQVKAALNNNLNNRSSSFVQLGNYMVNLNHIHRIDIIGKCLTLDYVDGQTVSLEFKTEELEALKEKCISLANTQD